MNIFAEKIIKYDTKTHTFGPHNIKMRPPLPLGSSVMKSHHALDNNQPMTRLILERMRRDLFIYARFQTWSKRGIYVHVIAAPMILVPSDNGLIQRRTLWLHLVPKELFHLLEHPEEYEWWSRAEKLV